MQCEQVQDLAGAYALGALDEPERTAVAEHIQSCAVCRAAVQEAENLVRRLALAAPLRRVPPALQARLMVTVNADLPAAEPAAIEEARVFDRAPVHAAPAVMAASKPDRWWAWRPAVATSVAVLFVFAASGWIAALQMQVNHLQQQSHVFQQGMSDVQGQRAALFLLTTTGSSSFPMEPVSPSLHAQGTVIWNASRQQCSILASQLPPAPSGESYHVWFLREGAQSWDSGKMTSGQQGSAEKTVDLHTTPVQQVYQVVIMLQPDQAGRADPRPILEAPVD